MMNLRSVIFAVNVAAVSMMATGCGNKMTPIASSPITGNAFQGAVFGGSQPIIGADIQLYAASSNGYGQPYIYGAGTSLLGTNSVKTGSTGGFSIGGDFTCPTYSTPVYLVATGGNPGLAAGTNANIALMVALGPCGGLNQNTHIKINELTTVASVWALSPFMSSIAGVGTSAGNVTGLTNAFATVNKLVDTSVGSLPGPALSTGALLPVLKMNTIADILANCVNSPGGSATDSPGGMVTDKSTPCGLLFGATTMNGVAPTDTITAALNLAQNPNIPSLSLFNKIPPITPFQPELTIAPADFGIIITYSGGALATPTGIAADAGGNIWVPNAGNNTVTKLDALGVTSGDATGYLSGESGFTTGALNLPTALAIDQSGSAFLANGGNNTVSKISADGSTSSVFQGGGLSGPSGVAIDASGDIWVSNSKGAGVTLISASGSLSSFSNGGIVAPGAIAIDPK